MKYTRLNNRPAHVVLDKAAFSHNLQRVRSLVPSAKVMAVIKADGYGHGMEFAADALGKADEFGVSSMDDVRRLRSAGVTHPITLLSASLSGTDYEILAEWNVRPTIYDWQQLSSLEKIKPAKALDVWLKIDTGMGRLGFGTEELQAVTDALSGLSCVGNICLMSHLANADAPENAANQVQLERFDRLDGDRNFAQQSILNSAGVMSFAQSAKDIVRPGLMLYGISPLLDKTSSELDLRPVMSFRSEIISVKSLPRGSYIGYGSTYQLNEDKVVGIVACGYGDGYPRHAPSGTPVLVNGQIAPSVGRVSMDMIAVDLSGISSDVGDLVELWGRDNPVETIAGLAGTIPYELCCGISNRVERIIV